ncbi:PREDICTED: sorting nexin-14-like [Cyphomyrmex costatus]|uniref:Sorting nexin-14 n=1 Tax=Cyphomyrmex costatus TaxID=456900 RepID=A0A195CLP3_9HYME|nr:PREDICTED: sorting nexin-14-like [Cyphomyrmex costatus]KYN01623.1 Sorting nexin-14 [Cyphomyrmex costatus]
MQDLYFFSAAISAIVILLVAFIVIVFNSILWVFIAISIYVIASFYAVQLVECVNSLLTRFNIINEQRVYGLLTRFNIINDKFIKRYEIKDSCSVCRKNTCKRHKLLPHSTKIKVPKDFDHALEQLLEEVLQMYICTWYSDISANEAFIQQLRLAITTVAKNITIRLLRADTATLAFDGLIPLAIQHAQDWKALLKISSSEIEMSQDYIGSCLSSKIHPASYSREAELNYLRGLVTALLPHLLPAIHVSTNNKVILREILSNWVLLPAIDALADPENINMLVTLSTHRETTLSNAAETITVPILQSWVTLPAMHSHITHSCFKPSLNEILSNPELLYMFMQHIKESGPMNLLQFYLDIEDLSKRMLNPDMTSVAEENLYVDVRNMYKIYLDPDGSEYLYLPLHISKGIRQVLEGGPKKIQELRTSRSFYQAHQEAHTLLESTCLPSFHHSYQLYKLLCGHLSEQIKATTAANASGGTSTPPMRFNNQVGKIDGVLRSTAIDGTPFQLQDVYPVEEVDCTARAYNEIKGFGDKSHRDLTTWRVAVPHVDGGGSQPVYMIAIHSVAEAKSWTVLRQDQDFYTLRTRLTEFHGDKELNDSPLPARKNPHLPLAANRQRYEEFLQKLLSKPMLRSSELLYTFLTTPNLKPYFANYSTPDIGILYQSMTYKLRKEKGQHLDKFMSTFLASTNTKYEHMDMGIEPSSEHLGETESKGRKLIDDVFGNNLNLPVTFQNLPCSLPQRDHMKGASLCIIEALDSLLSLPSIISRLFWMLAFLLRKRIDPYVNAMFYSTLVKLLSGGRASIVVKLLHAKIVGKNYIRDFPSQGKYRNYYETAKEGLHSLWWLMIFPKPWNNLMNSLLDPLQNAPFNKHLAYLLLDHLLVNLFPEVIA